MRAKHFLLLAPFLLAGAAGMRAAWATNQLSLPNVTHAGPLCVARFPASGAACEKNHCDLPAPASSTLPAIRINFACVPARVRFPYEYAQPGDAVRRERSANGTLYYRHLVPPPGNEVWGVTVDSDKVRMLHFCLANGDLTLCGEAQVQVLTDPSGSDGTASALTFLRATALDGR